jgi:hypothetical protein
MPQQTEWPSCDSRAGAGGEAPGCFLGCTKVLMADGSARRIDAIAIGDRVKARDEHTGVEDVAVVDRVFRRHVAKTLLLQLDGGEVIGTIPEHRFACDGRGFVSAGQLSPLDTLTAYGDRTSRVIGTELHPAQTTVYNLSLARLHTYFIGGAALWVHNVKKAEAADEC